MPGMPFHFKSLIGLSIFGLRLSRAGATGIEKPPSRAEKYISKRPAKVLNFTAYSFAVATRIHLAS